MIPLCWNREMVISDRTLLDGTNKVDCSICMTNSPFWLLRWLQRINHLIFLLLQMDGSGLLLMIAGWLCAHSLLAVIFLERLVKWLDIACFLATLLNRWWQLCKWCYCGCFSGQQMAPLPGFILWVIDDFSCSATAAMLERWCCP